jgi:hypothetical protein
MAGTADDHSTDEFRLLKDEYALILRLTGDSEQLAEDVVRTYFSHGPVDREGRERYTVYTTEAKLSERRFGGRAIYNPRDWQFWYSDPEHGISCIFEYRHSSLRWSGPMMYPKAPSAEDKEDEEVWQVDPQDKAEYRLRGIKLRHETLLDFLRRAGWLPLVQQSETAAEPAAELTQPQPEPVPESTPSEPAPASAPLSEQSEPQPAENTTLKSWVPRALADHPPPKDTKDVAGYLMQFAPKRWKKHSIQNVLSGLSPEEKPKPKKS